MLLGRRSIESSKPDAQSARLELNNPLAKILIKEKCDHIFAKNVKFEDEEFLAQFCLILFLAKLCPTKSEIERYKKFKPLIFLPEPYGKCRTQGKLGDNHQKSRTRGHAFAKIYLKNNIPSKNSSNKKMFIFV